MKFNFIYILKLIWCVSNVTISGIWYVYCKWYSYRVWVPVSYTHLDVYKRQKWGRHTTKVRETNLNQRSELLIDTYTDYTITLITLNNYNWNSFYKNNITADTGACLQERTSHILYTLHITDVYKRQVYMQIIRNQLTIVTKIRCKQTMLSKLLRKNVTYKFV